MPATGCIKPLCLLNLRIRAKRASGEPYIIHPVSQAIILADLKLDYGNIVAGLCDVIEDTNYKDEIKDNFGAVVANLLMAPQIDVTFVYV